MPDPFLLADARPRASARPDDGAVELVGRSAAIARVQELIRRGARARRRRAHHRRARRRTSKPSPASCTQRGRRAGLSVHRRRLRRRRTPRASIACCSANPPPVAPTDLEAVAADSRIAAARGGTLFLQNVTELRASAQAQLARIARDGEVRIDGAPVATAHPARRQRASPEIDADVHAHRFRGDLYRRLSTVRIDLPPLRDRPDDVPALALRLLEDRCAAAGRPPRTFTQAALALVGALTWPGNLAELRDAVDRVVADGAGRRDSDRAHLLPALQLHRAPKPFVPSGQPARRAAAVRARLHRVGPAASRLAHGAPPPRRWASNVPISTGRHDSSASRSCGCPTNAADHHHEHENIRLTHARSGPRRRVCTRSRRSRARRQTPPPPAQPPPVAPPFKPDFEIPTPDGALRPGDAAGADRGLRHRARRTTCRSSSATRRS